MFLILEISEMDGAWWSDWRIPAGKRPTYVHMNREPAERELFRLQLAYPGHEFVLFEATARAVPTRTRHDVLLLSPYAG